MCFFIGISSIACNFISNSWIITIIYTICTSIFTIFELTDTNGVPKKIINILINVNRKILFGLLMAIALSPTIVGFCRGEIIFAYCSKDSKSEIMRLTAIYKRLSLSKCTLIMIFLDDSEGEILGALTVKNILNRFSNADNERFQKHIFRRKI